MTGHVIDAGVMVKWLVYEDHSEEAVGLLDIGWTLFAPVLVLAEAANVLRAMRCCGDITTSDLAGAVGALRAVPVPLSVPMLRLAAGAARLAVDLDHPHHDCFHPASANQAQYPVATADARFHDKVSGAHAILRTLTRINLPCVERSIR